MHRNTRGWALGLTVALTIAGCDDPAPEGAYVGRVADDLFVALVVDGDRALAYVCDGTDAGVALGAWLDGAVDGDALAATHAKRPIRLDATFEGGLVRGALDLGEGAAMTFTAAPATGDAGLYQADDGDLRGGWIFDADGEQRGAVLNRNTGDVSAVLLATPAQRSALAFGATLTVRKVLGLAR